ncbi:hypothetical protein LZF95_01380 [Algoriphagus sp. AGSA1]|uniref:hypothetical protein n=1 Tax=Algoriphagus sp. AGSA1 TaxID=2907213 RepID=UPI001F3F616C|nr:hypothetical protein [Algoriphagus sp. AGSA1]MCE7053308.1 hypothetical protein [Algoriphagus sp. AGSA1]
MKNFKKVINEPHNLRVIPAWRATRDYFLSNFLCEAYQEQLDFIWEKSQKCKAVISFAISESGEAVSLPESPFGGFWIMETLSSSSIEAFISAVLEELGHRGIRSVTITQAPKPYEIQSDLINYLLFKSGFVQKKLVSHHFFIGRKKIKKQLQKETARLQSKSREVGLRISHSNISNFKFLKSIREWNMRKGYEITVDEDRLVRQVSEYPDRYFLTSLANNGEDIGYCLGVKLTSDSIYYYLSALNPQVNVKNGGELMLNDLFKVAVEQKVNFIDLGSSDLIAVANHSLMFFKSRFSNDVSNKVTWIKTI